MEVKNGDIVQHFKRELVEDKNSTEYLYKIISTNVIHTETKERLVVYESLYSNSYVKIGQLFARPYNMFLSEVDKNKYPNIHQKYRFMIYKD